MFRSERDDWGTPQSIFNELHKEFNFQMDACATAKNAKCPVFINEEQDCLRLPWSAYAKRVWMNPPYRRSENACKNNCNKKTCKRRGWCAAEPIPGTYYFVRKAANERKNGVTTVCLLPSRTGSKWWHQYVEPIRLRTPTDVRFWEGRITFDGGENLAPFDSVIVIFRGQDS